MCDAEAARRVRVPIREELDLIEIERLAPGRLRPGRVARDRKRQDAGLVELRSPVTQELELVRSGRRPGEEEEEKERGCLSDEIRNRRRLAWRHPNRGPRNSLAGLDHSEANRGDSIDELTQTVPLRGRRSGVEEEAAEPFGLVVFERDRRLDSCPFG